MTVRRLTRAELPEFQARYEVATGYPPPLDYLIQATVYGYFRRSELIGGFSVNTVAPWRYLGAMPAEARPPFKADMEGVAVVEIACTWLAQDVRKSARSWGLWWYILQATRTGEGVLFGTTVEALANAYRAVLRPTREYAGELEFDGEQTTGWVFLAGRPAISAFIAAARQKRKRRR